MLDNGLHTHHDTASLQQQAAVFRNRSIARRDLLVITMVLNCKLECCTGLVLREPRRLRQNKIHQRDRYREQSHGGRQGDTHVGEGGLTDLP